MTPRMATRSRRSVPDKHKPLRARPSPFHPVLLLSALLTGCAVGPHYQRPALDLPSSFAPATQAESATPLAAKWWTLYGDPMLDDLVTAALMHNTDIRLAIARIDEAAAILTETGANLLPEIGLEGSVTRSRTSTLTGQPLQAGAPAISNSHRLALSTTFEVDFWGKLQRAKQAAAAELIASHYAQDVTALTLAGTTTQAYFNLRALDAQIAVSRQTLATREEALAVVKSRARGGLAGDLEVHQAEGARADAALQGLELERQRALIEHQLGSLTGNLDLRIGPGNVMSLPRPTLPPPGLPSTLLERRPDVREAEQNLIAANARIGMAKADQFPTFTLTGLFGAQSEAFNDLFKDGARIWSIGPSVSLPILDGGKSAARTRQAEARQRQSLANYQRTVEAAFREVADALNNVRYTNASSADTQIKVDAARHALRLSRRRYEAGYAAYLEVLDAQRSVNTAELELVQHRLLQLIYSVDLMKALGGGWAPGMSAPVAQR